MVGWIVGWLVGAHKDLKIYFKMKAVVDIQMSLVTPCYWVVKSERNWHYTEKYWFNLKVETVNTAGVIYVL